MRTATEIPLGKGKHEYVVTGTLIVDDDPHPLDLEVVKKRVEQLYAVNPWIDSDYPTVPRTATVTAVHVPKSGKQGLFEALCGGSGYIRVEIRLNACRLRQSQLRSFERCVALIEHTLRTDYYFLRQVVAGVGAWKEVGHFAA